MNSNDLKQIPVGTSIHKETWDHCTNCDEHTPIGNMNLVAGRCFNCSPSKMRLTLEQMQKLCELDVGVDDEFNEKRNKKI